MSEELNPCPYCGDAMPVVSEAGKCYTIECGCGMNGPYGCEPEDAIASWNSLPRHLYWTKDVLSTSGKYMYRDKDGISFADVNCEESTVWLIDRDCIADLDELNGEWAGPIPEPKESKDD